MRVFFIISLVVFNLFATQNTKLSQEPKVMLESVREHAIKIGDGNAKVVYIFVDPMCKFSKKIIKTINDNKMLQLTNTYYIFLYRLPRLDSEKLIQYVYQSNDQKTTLLEVMVDEEVIDLDDFQVTDKTIRAIQTISDIAKKLDMTVRPYMISFEKDSKYCSVSQGIASCLEELED